MKTNKIRKGERRREDDSATHSILLVHFHKFFAPFLPILGLGLLFCTEKRRGLASLSKVGGAGDRFGAFCGCTVPISLSKFKLDAINLPTQSSPDLAQQF